MSENVCKEIKPGEVLQLKSFIIIMVQLWICQLTSCVSSNTSCVPRRFGQSSVVCVCNGTYCDELDITSVFQLLESGSSYVQVMSSLDGHRFHVNAGNVKYEDIILSYGNFEMNLGENPLYQQPQIMEIWLNQSQRYQKILGFGGAFTDASVINLASVSSELQQHILRSYFGQNGLNYTFGRVPIAGTDFSTHVYTYDDSQNDTALEHFGLAQEDISYKIPFIHKARELQPSLKLLAASWTAPKWMKTDSSSQGCGFLQEQFYQLWAEYLVKFLTEYKSHNLTFWGLSTQNEPLDGLIPHFPFNCMGWSAEQQRDWIKFNLGPTMGRTGFENLRIVTFDDQRPFINTWIKAILGDPNAASYVSGIGIHWYADFFPASILDIAHSSFPNHFLLATEACVGSLPGEHQVLLGSWERAEEYAHSIIQDLNHWVVGWIDWNLVLDLNGGPNWASNFVDAPIIVDSDANLAYKQPMYYILGHFSAFIPENSIRVHHDLVISTHNKSETESNSQEPSSREMPGLEVLSIERPDGLIVIVILNKLEEAISVKILEESDYQTKILQVEVGPRSIQTIISKM